ncbi:hypothetical protein GCM10008967_38480 [Bacillus carboniphilus]|uniref:Uncharacterized protein n=1 Tax=Bacillus carboniphilus TaxID=86663 RepID=A0ABP3GGJ7_9BACI
MVSSIKGCVGLGKINHLFCRINLGHGYTKVVKTTNELSQYIGVKVILLYCSTNGKRSKYIGGVTMKFMMVVKASKDS